MKLSYLSHAHIIIVLAVTSLSKAAIEVQAIGKVYEPLEGRTAICTARSDLGGSTSVRNVMASNLKWKNQGYFQRNRDLGQVFMPTEDFKVDAIVLRTGPSDSAVKAGAPGAELFLQFFRVVGSPRINNNGTGLGTDSKHGFSKNHRCDDYIEGVAYRSIHIARGGVFPDLPPTKDESGNPTGNDAGKLHYFRLDLTGADELVFKAGNRYAFMLGFVEPGPERAFTLGNYNAAGVNAEPSLTDGHDYNHDGWGLRREGDGTKPPTMTGLAEPPSDEEILKILFRESLFDVPPKRFELSPTTEGYPDVDTYRDLEFYIEVHSSTLCVTKIESPPGGAAVRISQPYGRRGPTSFRLTTDAERNLKQSPSVADAEHSGGRYWKRDRDLGQTFTVPEGEPFLLDAITLRVGPSGYGTFDHGGAGGAAVSLQIMVVSGTPRINDNGTTSGTVSKAYPNDARADDYITGETYEHLMIARGGILPEQLTLGGPVLNDPLKTFNTTKPTKQSTGTLLRFDLLGDAEIALQPKRRYAFLVMFDEPAASRALPLDNWDNFETMGAYAGGHAIRREGSVEHPWKHPYKVFRGGDDAESRHASELPSEWHTRLNMQPSTWGRPDVDTYRDLLFYIEGKTAPQQR